MPTRSHKLSGSVPDIKGAKKLEIAENREIAPQNDTKVLMSSIHDANCTGSQDLKQVLSPKVALEKDAPSGIVVHVPSSPRMRQSPLNREERNFLNRHTLAIEKFAEPGSKERGIKEPEQKLKDVQDSLLHKANGTLPSHTQGLNSTQAISGIQSPQESSVNRVEVTDSNPQLHENTTKKTNAPDWGMLPKIPTKNGLKKS